MRSTVPISVTARDRDRLLQVADTFIARQQDILVQFLLQEVGRATVVASAEIPRGVATMHSRVRYRDERTGEVRTASLVYPGDEDNWLGRVSVLSQTGAALLGLSEGQTISWRDFGGRQVCLTLLDVVYQPEAAGRYDL